MTFHYDVIEFNNAMPTKLDFSPLVKANPPSLIFNLTKDNNKSLKYIVFMWFHNYPEYTMQDFIQDMEDNSQANPIKLISEQTINEYSETYQSPIVLITKDLVPVPLTLPEKQKLNITSYFESSLNIVTNSEDQHAEKIKNLNNLVDIKPEGNLIRIESKGNSEIITIINNLYKNPDILKLSNNTGLPLIFEPNFIAFGFSEKVFGKKSDLAESVLRKVLDDNEKIIIFPDHDNPSFGFIFCTNKAIQLTFKSFRIGTSIIEIVPYMQFKRKLKQNIKIISKKELTANEIYFNSGENCICFSEEGEKLEPVPVKIKNFQVIDPKDLFSIFGNYSPISYEKKDCFILYVNGIDAKNRLKQDLPFLLDE